MTVEAAEQALGILDRVAIEGAARAERSLTELMGQEIRIHAPQVRIGTELDACEAVGGPDTLVLGSYLSVAGDVTAHVMLLFPVPKALEIVDLMSGQDLGTATEVDDYARSAIGELGNIVGSAFINALADAAKLILHPSPPLVVHDMANALVTSVYAEILQQGSVVMIDTVFEDGNGNIAGLLVVAPDPECMPQILEIVQ